MVQMCNNSHILRIFSQHVQGFCWFCEGKVRLLKTFYRPKENVSDYWKRN